MKATLKQFENLYVLDFGSHHFLTADPDNIAYLIEEYNLEIYEPYKAVEPVQD